MVDAELPDGTIPGAGILRREFTSYVWINRDLKEEMTGRR